MYKLSLIGYPLSHSISGVIQKAALESLNLEGTYEILETNPEDLINRIKYLKVNNYNGFNVTIPLKVTGYNIGLLPYPHLICILRPVFIFTVFIYVVDILFNALLSKF